MLHLTVLAQRKLLGAQFAYDGFDCILVCFDALVDFRHGIPQALFALRHHKLRVVVLEGARSAEAAHPHARDRLQKTIHLAMCLRVNT